MAENLQADEQEKDLRSKLLKRLGIAGLLVLLLLGALALFDHLSFRREEVSPKIFTKPVPVPPKKELTQAVKPVLPITESAGEGSPPAGATETPITPTPVAQEPVEAQPVKAAEPVKTVTATEKSTPVPATKAVVTAPKTTQVAASKTPSAKTVPAPVSEETAPPVVESVPAAKSAPEAQVQTSVVRTPQPVLLAPAPSLPRLLVGFVVQAGVFTNARKAEELHAKLALNGIPSSMEARIHLGPFKTRAEAEAARQKLKALGIDGMLIPPAGRR